MHIEIWQWLVLGIALCVVEVFVPSFTLLWFGLGAFVVALIAALIPLSLAAELLIWALATAIFAIAWFKFFKPLMLDKTKAGISREAAVGQIGIVVKASSEQVRGNVRFTVPLLGQEDWPYLCETELHVGDRCRVKDVLGNALLVEKF